MLDLTIKTERLALRPFRQDDAESVESLIGDWDVARMLERVPHPYPKGDARAWIATHDERRANGSFYPFAIDRAEAVVGCISLREADGAPWRQPGKVLVIGYWIGRPFWGRGFMTEAAAAVTTFAFGWLAATCLASSHFEDNPASGRVLSKLGFERVNAGSVKSLARDSEAVSAFLTLTRDAWAAKKV